MEVDRTSHDLRPMTCELGHLSRSDGSATLTQGDTTVITSMYGPGDVRISKEIIDKATVEVTYKPKVGLPKCSDKLKERLIRNTCETVILSGLHPRTGIDIILQEMQNSGSFLSCCINSACLALLDASIPLKYLIAAVTCCISDRGEITLDPDLKQEKKSVAILTFVFDSKDFNVITVSTSGSFSNEQFQSCLMACREASKHVIAFYRESMLKKLSKSV
ncbi:exosome complex component RRP46 [Patella vulgata]|uniref:exosome complex component RRP46 n=1 Tax=Patella vulgata TaxID=6465 RepID=UPI00217FE747|nr:exosome complex component RRP46 [Patella vulgata]XP_050393973.1 exosome complex component RRP46 [Patella vulgata]XP_050393974.1 exosome complex component RRP46 [Patella vulgata]XP_050393975.1 exosome complex component RRP46 [Patella vulgata]XP_055955185.1 exosome complex component RRP46 [Patella vulgata]